MNAAPYESEKKMHKQQASQVRFLLHNAGRQVLLLALACGMHVKCCGANNEWIDTCT